VRNIDPLTFPSRPATNWDEVVVALCGIVEHPDEVVGQVLTVDPALAIRCIASGVLLEPQTRRKTIEHLIACLRGDNWVVTVSVAQALQNLKEHDAVPALVAILQEKSEKKTWVVDPREAAALVLGAIGGEVAVAGLRQALNCESAAVRARAAESLGRIGDPGAIPDLAFHLGDIDWTGHPGFHYGTTTTDAAGGALVRIAQRSPEAVVLALLDALRSPHAITRARAAEVLGSVADRDAVPGLSDALTYDVDPRVRVEAKTALRKIHKPTAKQGE
jgi:HEAT repeat protein